MRKNNSHDKDAFDRFAQNDPLKKQFEYQYHDQKVSYKLFLDMFIRDLSNRDRFSNRDLLRVVGAACAVAGLVLLAAVLFGMAK